MQNPHPIARSELRQRGQLDQAATLAAPDLVEYGIWHLGRGDAIHNQGHDAGAPAGIPPSTVHHDQKSISWKKAGSMLDSAAADNPVHPQARKVRGEAGKVEEPERKRLFVRLQSRHTPVRHVRASAAILGPRRVDLPREGGRVVKVTLLVDDCPLHDAGTEQRTGR
jgi:hypothetical protein